MTYLSYSGWKGYVTCPESYWHRYVNKTVLTIPENGVNSLYGSTVGIVFEHFYRDRIWKDPNYLTTLRALGEPTLDKAIKDQIKQGRIIDFSDEKSNYPKEKDGLTPSAALQRGREEMLADVDASIIRGVNTIRENRFVGPVMEPELKLDTKFGPHIVGGRADFVIERMPPHNDIVILDGKGSRHREKYLDGKPRKKGEPVEGIQLKWYAVLYREKYGRTPNTLAYVFWRYSDEQAVEWVPFTEGDLDNLKAEILAAVKRIDRTTAQIDEVSSVQSKRELREELFPAQVGHHCTLCAYTQVCEPGKKYVAQFEGRKRRVKVTLPKGVTELSLGLDDD